jgi:hypothetical protein
MSYAMAYRIEEAVGRGESFGASVSMKKARKCRPYAAEKLSAKMAGW